MYQISRSPVPLTLFLVGVVAGEPVALAQQIALLLLDLLVPLVLPFVLQILVVHVRVGLGVVGTGGILRIVLQILRQLVET